MLSPRWESPVSRLRQVSQTRARARAGFLRDASAGAAQGAHRISAPDGPASSLSLSVVNFDIDTPYLSQIIW